MPLRQQDIKHKANFDIDEVMIRIRAAVKPYPPAAMFQLAEEGFNSLFEQLVGCIISIRTYDEVTVPTARKLFAVARTPSQIDALNPAQIDTLIHNCTFHEPKAKTIKILSQVCLEQFGSSLPCDQQAILKFRGIGPKCANLALGIACGQISGIPVDIHVHRVTNRWGYVIGKTPEHSMAELEKKLPRRYWLEINRLLIPFGKNICTHQLPHCSTCPVLEMCRQVGVSAHR